MYLSKYRKDLSLMRFPGRIPFVEHLWWCLKQYCILAEMETWEVVEEREIERSIDLFDDTWGHYDAVSEEWIKL